MQFSNPATLLSSTDYARLQRLMLTMIGSRTVLAALLRRKLGASAPAPSSSLASNRAVSGKRVRFSIDGGRAEECVLTWQPPRSGDRNTLSLLSPRGLALMGLTPGEFLFYRTESDRTEFIRVESVSSEGVTGHRPPVNAVPVHGRAPQVSAQHATEDSIAGVVDA
jgi:regulator of nucleoside diphosphate kinase